LGRRSRKRKPSAAPGAGAIPKPREAAPDPNAALRDRYARSRERDAAVRATLEPLAAGERPGAVTIAAALAFVMAVANVAAALAGESLGSSATGFTVLSTAILLACAGGMWFGARHWAVLGFMMVLVFQILSLSFALIKVRHWWVALIIVAVIGLLGWVFWKLIRALARIQMPERPQPRPR
jgi:hypothetical protein